jgi:hypothetical protein
MGPTACMLCLCRRPSDTFCTAPCLQTLHSSYGTKEPISTHDASVTLHNTSKSEIGANTSICYGIILVVMSSFSMAHTPHNIEIKHS